MGVEEPIEMALVGVCEMIGPPQQGGGTGQVRMLGALIGVAALELSSHQGEALGEPAGDVKAVQHMAAGRYCAMAAWYERDPSLTTISTCRHHQAP